MAENRPPTRYASEGHNFADTTTMNMDTSTTKAKRTPTKHIDFAALRKGKSPMATRRANVIQPEESRDVDMEAPGGDKDHLGVIVDTQRMQLISPPPEEMLRKVSSSALRPHGQLTPSHLGDRSPGPASMTLAKDEGSSSKRKRSQAHLAFGQQGLNSASSSTEPPQPVEATPNPKPRKQGRHVRLQSMDSPTKGSLSKEKELNTTPSKPKKMVVIKSPHARNPDADWIPPVVLSDVSPSMDLPNPSVRRAALAHGSRRRSATPIPHYEPPTDVFTPPREVFLSPLTAPKSVSKSSKRKVVDGKKKTLRVNTSLQTPNGHVKQEIPDDIDLTAPMPPASPTDDPLLLSGPPEPVVEEGYEEVSTPVREMGRSVSVQVQTQPPWEDDVLPPSSPEPPLDTEEADAVTTFDWQRQEDHDPLTDDSMMQMDDPLDAGIAPVRLFDLDDMPGSGGDAGWSDSDDDDAQEKVNEDGELEGEGEYTGRWRMTRIRTKLDPPSSATKSRMEMWGRPISPFPKVKSLDFLGEEEEDEDEVRQMSVDSEGRDEEEEEEEEEVRQMSVGPENHDSEEEEEVHQMSMQMEEEPELPNQATELPDEVGPSLDTHLQDAKVQESSADYDEDDSSDTDEEAGLVKITSADPRAAARAVAILKQHDYDCYTKLIKRRASHSAADDFAKKSRRRDVASAGVSKSAHKNHRRSTLGMGVIGDKVFIPGTPVTTLPELLQEAEKDVRETTSHLWSIRKSTGGVRDRDPFKTPLPDRFHDKSERRISAPHAEVQEGEREWTRDDWKLLDACFTDQRLELGDAQQGILASVDIVAPEDIVSRFVDMMGGQSLVDTFGEAWARDNLLDRTRALQQKQRSGIVAPPTPRTPYSFVSPSVAASHPVAIPTITLGGQKRYPTMEVPDFTPLYRGRAAPPRKYSSRSVLPPRITQDAPFENLHQEAEISMKKLPLALMAPRYSHLLDEAVAISQEGSTSSQLGDNSADASFDSSIKEASPRENVSDNSSVTEGEDGETSDSELHPTPSSSLGKRVKGFFYSYLPTISKTPCTIPSRKVLRPAQPGLPLPPQSILEKPRGPVTTPARPPLPRVPHPKELVHLHPAPSLSVSNIPRAKMAPKRLVDLAHVPPRPKDNIQTVVVPRSRRSSGSVKDLVKGFEHMDEMAKKVVAPGRLHKTESMGDLKKVWRQGQPDTRPKWKF